MDEQVKFCQAKLTKENAIPYTMSEEGSVCNQAVRLRKRDNVWVHIGYKRMHEPYKDFIQRTNHKVEVSALFRKSYFLNSSGLFKQALFYLNFIYPTSKFLLFR